MVYMMCSYCINKKQGMRYLYLNVFSERISGIKPKRTNKSFPLWGRVGVATGQMRDRSGNENVYCIYVCSIWILRHENILLILKIRNLNKRMHELKAEEN